MAFNQANFAPVHSRTSNVPGHWTYKTSVDNANIVLEADYFADKVFQLEIDDQIYVSAADVPFIMAYKGAGQPSIILAPEGTPGGPIPATNVSYDPSSSQLTSTNVQAALDEVAVAAFDTPNEIMEAESLLSQMPTVSDVPLQVSFGPAQGTVSDPVMTDAAGTLTVNQADYYTFKAVFQFARTSAGGQAILHARALLNGFQANQTYSVILDNSRVIIPLEFSLAGNVPANTLITVEIVRDSAGSPDGGLESFVPTLGWQASPSASITVIKGN